MTAREFLDKELDKVLKSKESYKVDWVDWNENGVPILKIIPEKFAEAFHKAATEEAIHKVDEVMQKHADKGIMQMVSAIAFRSSLLHFLGLGKIPQKVKEEKNTPNIEPRGEIDDDILIGGYDPEDDKK